MTLYLIMNFKKYLSLIFFASVILSCKKSEEPVAIIPEIESKPQITDSISIVLDGKPYFFKDGYSYGSGNTQTNVKPYNEPIPDRKAANETAGKFWYGEKDSILYFTHYGLSMKEDWGNFKIYFAKKFAISEMDKGTFLWIPKDHREIFKVGKQSFAIDFEKESKNEGVVLELFIAGKQLSSVTPGFSIAVQSHRTDIQDNSTFEIKKLEQIEGDNYYIEAEFSMNLYDQEEKLYRIEKGYLRKTINITRNILL